MKIKRKDIAKDLRLMGCIYNILLNEIPKKESKKIHNVKKIKNDSNKRNYYEYLKREDNSLMRLMIMRPKNKDKKVPGILWIHGGGYAYGMPEMAIVSMPKYIYKMQNSVIISPRYRLSSEKPFPAALDDCYDALEWMVDNAGSLGINTDQIFVGGESAGGGLAIVLCLLARDRKKINIAFQMPIYPMINAKCDTKSMINNNAPVWNEKQTIAG